MYVYLITNQINNKKYVGITNDYKRRWANHGNKGCDMAISKAIRKYGKNNFTFELLEKNIPLEQIDDKEKYYIEKLETHVSTGKGYNVTKGGKYNIDGCLGLVGTKNGRSLLTEEQVQFIKSHRNIPEMVLYEDYCDIISYASFKKVYLDKTYKDIKPTVEIYPFNLEFSSQFNSGKLTYSEVVDLREKYNNKVFWKDAYTDYYKKLYPDELSFWNVYVGNRYKLVMPEVFTAENKHFQASKSHAGSDNGRAKLTWDDVNKIRKLFESGEKTRKELQEMYSQVSTTTINNILKYKTWKIK